MEIEDLKAAVEHCRSIEVIAEFLCRADSVDDASRKCQGLSRRPERAMTTERVSELFAYAEVGTDILTFVEILHVASRP
jgi:hypothetical protein